MTFHVGQKVVCVRVDGDDGRFGLRINSIYTISALGIGESGEPVCDIAEIKTWLPGAWRTSCFRPIVEKKTDIGFAHEILRKVSRKQTVSA